MNGPRIDGAWWLAAMSWGGLMWLLFLCLIKWLT